MKGRFFCANGLARCIRSASKPLRRALMSRKQQKPVARKPSKKIADARRVRYGAGMAPAAIRDSGKVRFGAGMMPANLRK